MGRRRLVKCKDCGEDISRSAKSCPNCGVPVKRTSLFNWMVLVFGVIIIYNSFFGKDKDEVLDVKGVVSDVKYEPYLNGVDLAELRRDFSVGAELLVESWKCRKSYNNTIFSGSVKNISGQSLRKVMAVASLNTSAGDLIDSNSGFIEYTALLPEQSSPFKVYVDDNPVGTGCRLAFKFFTGEKINSVDKKTYVGKRKLQVQWVQAMLKELGYVIEVDGVSGPKTLEMVKDFQVRHGVNDDGLITYSLALHINRVINLERKHAAIEASSK